MVMRVYVFERVRVRVRVRVRKVPLYHFSAEVIPTTHSSLSHSTPSPPLPPALPPILQAKQQDMDDSHKPKRDHHNTFTFVLWLVVAAMVPAMVYTEFGPLWVSRPRLIYSALKLLYTYI